MVVLHITPLRCDKLSWGDDDFNIGLGHHYLISFAKKNIGNREICFKVCTEDAFESITKLNPDIIALSALSFNHKEAFDIARFAKSLNKVVIMGGHHISATFMDYFPDDIDMAILGEGEETFVDLICNFYDNDLKFKDIDYIKGIAYKNGQNVKITNPRMLINDLDDLGHIERKEAYLTKSIERSMFTSRGCAYNCVFCGSCFFWGNKIRYHSPKYVIDEIENIYSFSHTDHISIDDIMFSINKVRLREMVKLWKQHELYGKIVFTVNARANHIDKEMSELLKEFGVFTAFIGFESNDIKTLKYLKKDTVSPEDNQNAYDLLTNKGINVFGSFVIDSPVDTHESIMKTYEFVKKNAKMCGFICNLVPLPGTELLGYATTHDLIDKDIYDYISSYSIDDVKKGKYIHLCPNITQKELVQYIELFNEEFSKRTFVMRNHKSKFRINC